MAIAVGFRVVRRIPWFASRTTFFHRLLFTFLITSLPYLTGTDGYVRSSRYLELYPKSLVCLDTSTRHTFYTLPTFLASILHHDQGNCHAGDRPVPSGSGPSPSDNECHRVAVGVVRRCRLVTPELARTFVVELLHLDGQPNHRDRLAFFPHPRGMSG